jgi:hypothetical protein
MQRHVSKGYIALLLAALVLAPLPAEAGHRGTRAAHRPAHATAAVRHYYVDFLARTSGPVGHSYIRLGALDARGGAHPTVTAGFYAADLAHVWDAPGVVKATARDLREVPAARYRVAVGERTYRRMQALLERLHGSWHQYDLVGHNCNHMVGLVAGHLGLAVPGEYADLPVNYVRALAAANGGRTHGSWR